MFDGLCCGGGSKAGGFSADGLQRNQEWSHPGDSYFVKTTAYLKTGTGQSSEGWNSVTSQRSLSKVEKGE